MLSLAPKIRLKAAVWFCDATPTVVLFSQTANLRHKQPARCDRYQSHCGRRSALGGAAINIKTTQLLYSCMAKQMAQQAGAHDAWMVEDGFNVALNLWVSSDLHSNLCHQNRSLILHFINPLLHRFRSVRRGQESFPRFQLGYFQLFLSFLF